MYQQHVKGVFETFIYKKPYLRGDIGEENGPGGAAGGLSACGSNLKKSLNIKLEAEQKVRLGVCAPVGRQIELQTSDVQPSLRSAEPASGQPHCLMCVTAAKTTKKHFSEQI